MNIEEIKGIGESTKKKLNSLDIYTINDLQEYYPYRYNINHFINLLDSKEDEVCMVNASILEIPRVQYIKRNFNKLSFKAMVDGNIINVVIFNRAYLKQNLTINKIVALVGKYDRLKMLFTASDIRFNVENNTIDPVYHLVKGLKNSNLSKLIKVSLNYPVNEDLIPNSYINKYNYISKIEALRYIHNPLNLSEIKIAQDRLKYEELFNYMFKINYLSKINKKVKGIKRDVAIISIDNFCNSLEFNLTNDQNKAIKEIYNDMTSDKRMNRLILGDVGSGKTVVATYAIYLNFLSGYQTAFMAPTEILAEQHYKSLSKILNKFNIKVGLLTGSMKSKDKKEVLDKLKNGDINIVIGTHALISDNVLFNNLSLVITDEQHRFGVNQRNILSNKGITPDVLYLSATPIPRTYALTIYGDLDISMIKTKPVGRKEIITKVVKEDKIKDVLYKMLEELKNNHQIYVVSPLIENSDEESNLKSVIELKDRLNIAFHNKVSIEILHGKLKQNEKDKIMNNFKLGNIKILISTTVIEVGIDIPNSTMMVIYNAERFGLATLHQLRGRVGRSVLQSYCYLICNKEIERLKVLEESNDGFYISERDFEMRGGGDLFGVRQSGDILFKIASLKDYNILLKAKEDSLEYIEKELYKDNKYYLDIINNISFIH